MRTRAMAVLVRWEHWPAHVALRDEDFEWQVFAVAVAAHADELVIQLLVESR